MSGTKKKASIGASMTWVVATIIIFLMSVLFVYVAFVIAEKKSILNENSFVERIENYKPISLYSEQMLLALLNTKYNENNFKADIESQDYETFKANFKNREAYFKPIIEKLPMSENNLKWSLIIEHFGNPKPGDPFSPPFVIGRYKEDTRMDHRLQGLRLQTELDCSSVYIKNALVNLCKLS